ncbi:MAG: RluA family pseudouridine synthase, partial [Candidatus Moraniibacteriota bacterium]
MKQQKKPEVNPVRSLRGGLTRHSSVLPSPSLRRGIKQLASNGVKTTSPKPTTQRESRVVKLRFVGKRLDQFLAETLPLSSRGEWQRLIRSGQVRIAGEVVSEPRLKLGLGQVVDWPKVSNLNPKEVTVSTLAKILSEVKVLAETDDMLVLSKPAGISMHPVRRGQSNTLTEWLSTRYPQILGVGEAPERPGMVHRLDKDTSGIVLVAKTQKAFMALKKLFQERKIQKEYLALVYGTVSSPSGVIDKPLGRVKGSIRRATPDGKRTFGGELREALTEYGLHTRYPQYDLLSLKPKTGRTHQIRVHLASLGHPVV